MKMSSHLKMKPRSSSSLPGKHEMKPFGYRKVRLTNEFTLSLRKGSPPEGDNIEPNEHQMWGSAM
mgnify:CR=1 FL=1